MTKRTTIAAAILICTQRTLVVRKRQTDRQTDRRIDGKQNRQIDRQIKYRQIDRQIKYRQTNEQWDRESNRRWTKDIKQGMIGQTNDSGTESRMIR